jgi:hypothetical protein
MKPITIMGIEFFQQVEICGYTGEQTLKAIFSTSIAYILDKAQSKKIWAASKLCS